VNGEQGKPVPVPMILHCPGPRVLADGSTSICGARHIDEGEFATTKIHHTHSCQVCGHTWRPAVVPTVGVQFLPGFKSETSAEQRPSSGDVLSHLVVELRRMNEHSEQRRHETAEFIDTAARFFKFK
jgi:hypothetical protein